MSLSLSGLVLVLISLLAGQVHFPPAQLPEALDRRGCRHHRRNCRRDGNAMIVQAFAFAVGGSHQHRAGVLATARAVCGHTPAPAGTVRSWSSRRIEQRLVTPVAFGGDKRQHFARAARAADFIFDPLGVYAARLNLRRPIWPNCSASSLAPALASSRALLARAPKPSFSRRCAELLSRYSAAVRREVRAGRFRAALP